MNVDVIFWSFLLFSLLTGSFGYWLAYQTLRAKILNNLKKNYSEYEMFRIMFHINDFKIKPSIEEKCPLIQSNKIRSKES